MGWRVDHGIRLFATVATVIVAVGVLAGCAPSRAEPTATPQPAVSNPVEPTAVPTLDPQGTALQNLAYFDLVGHQLLDAKPNSQGRTIIDHFVAAGFVKHDMEVTNDKTAVQLNADNIEFSVRINGTCIIGQSGNTNFQSFAAPLLADGHCLVGKTRPIDW